MKKAELQVVVNQTPGSIECNFDELESALKTQMEAYKGLPITTETEKERKEDRATLRKIKTAIEDRRKAIKREYCEPLDEFEGKVKRLTSVLDGQIKEIDTGLKALDKKRVEERMTSLRAIWEKEVPEDLREIVTFEAAYRKEWENKGYTDKKVRGDVQEMVLQVKSDINSIRMMRSEIEDKCLEVYRQTRSLSLAIAKNAEYLEAKETIKAREIAQNAQKPAVEETYQTPTEKPAQGRTEWKFTVYSESDAQVIRDALDLFRIKYQEG